MVEFDARDSESVDGLCQDLVENFACEHGAAITENSEGSTITDQAKPRVFRKTKNNLRSG